MELWGGVECTLNRVGEGYFWQCERNGHDHRIEDLQLFATLKITKIRYPCLWESVVRPGATAINDYDWTWLDERLPRLRELGIKPIAGLLHHGSGPRFTNLLDPEFPEKFAAYARAFAERYPWVSDYTPVDEILTTARFSALYGHWYPHANDDQSFLRALYNQVKGTLLAMQEVRKINPEAQWIQAEDIGRAQSTERLGYQCHFENLRRWLSLDLLCGRMTPENPMYDFVHSRGLSAEELQWLVDHAKKPDVIGLNHYLLSNRFLDHRLELYPPSFHGGNHREPYADVGAIDTFDAAFIPPEEIFWEVWERYQIPIAVTEVHLRGHREDQMRWFHQIWEGMLRIQQRGADVRAVTAWSLLGTYNWNSLCTRDEGFYEPGVFDLRTADFIPRETGLSQMLKEIGHHQKPQHPVLHQPGWWESRRRLLHTPDRSSPVNFLPQCRPLVVMSDNGPLGKAFARICEYRDIPYRLFTAEDLDVLNRVEIEKLFSELKPWGLVNMAGYSNVDQAEAESELCFLQNVAGSVNLAEACAHAKIPFVTFSTDLVFNGELSSAYLESHETSPLNAFGRSKAESESKVLNIHPKSLVIRTSPIFGPWDPANFATSTLQRLLQNESVATVSDTRCSPTYIPDLVHAILDLMIDGASGIMHLANEGGVSWSEFARLLVDVSHKTPAPVNGSLLIEKKFEDFGFAAQRPRNRVLASEKIKVLPALDDAIHRYFSELEVPLR